MNTRSVLSAVALFVLILARADGQAGRVMRVDPAQMPPTMVLQKGTTLQFFGTLPAEGLPITFVVRVGANVRATGEFQKQWQLEWNTAKEQSSTVYLTLTRIEPNGAERRLARCAVQLVEGQPFHITKPAANSETPGMLDLVLEASGGTRIMGGEWLCDRNSRNAPIDTKGTGKMNLAGLKPGPHDISARVQMDGSAAFETEPIRVVLTPVVQLVRDGVGPIDIKGGESRVPVHLTLPMDLKATSVEYTVNGKPIGVSKTPPFDDVTISTAGMASGTYSLAAEVVTAEGLHHLTPDLKVEIIGNAEEEYRNWRTFLGRVLAEETVIRKEYTEVERQYPGQKTLGDLRIALRKLLNADITVAENIEKVTVPPSLPGPEREAVTACVQQYHIAFSKLINAERATLRYYDASLGKTDSQIKSDTYIREYYGDKSQIHLAELIFAGADDRLAHVEQSIESGFARTRAAGGRTVDPQLTYPITGNGKQDFGAWRNQLEQLKAGAEELWRQYQASGGTQKEIALKRVLTNDVWLSENLMKMQPPASLSGPLRQTLGGALNDYASAFSFRSRADRVLLRKLQEELGTAPPGPAVNYGDATDLLHRRDIVVASAEERIKQAARQLGLY